MTFVLGPCPCKGCRKRVYWDGTSWCDADGLGHVCRRPFLFRLRDKARSIAWARAA